MKPTKSNDNLLDVDLLVGRERRQLVNQSPRSHHRKRLLLIGMFALVLIFLAAAMTHLILSSSHRHLNVLLEESSKKWPCSDGKKPSEDDLLSGAFWSCSFVHKNLDSPKDRIPKSSKDKNALRVAYVSDQGMSNGTNLVMQQIAAFKPDLVIQNGDFDYQDDPKGWMKMIDSHLPVSVPFLAVIGNHDVKEYQEYQRRLVKRLKKGGFLDSCFGAIGIVYFCNIYGMLVTFSHAGTIGSGFDDLQESLMESYMDLVKSEPAAIKWRVCSFHKVMHDYQAGKKPDESGYEIYETCRKFGAMIVNGHEHSYSRTRNMLDYPGHVFDESGDPDQMQLRPGINFAVITGMGGFGRNPATEEARSNKWWAKIVAPDYEENVLDGALYCVYEGKTEASCEWKDTSGKVWDSFHIYNQ